MNFLMVSAWMLWLSDALETRTLFCFWHGCCGYIVCSWNTSVHLLWAWMLLVVVLVCSWNTSVIMLWAWMLLSSSPLEHELSYGFGMDALVLGCFGTRTLFCFWHGCCGYIVCSWNTSVHLLWAWMLLVVGLVCSWNTSVIMLWAWMLLSSSPLEHELSYGFGMDALVLGCFGTRTLFCFWHGCCGYIVCSWNTSVHLLWAWMLLVVVLVCSWNTSVIMLWA